MCYGKKRPGEFPRRGLPLKNHGHPFLTRNENYKSEDAIIVHSIEELMEGEKVSAEDVYCIGGDTIYKQLLPCTMLLQVTKIDFAYIAGNLFSESG